MKKTQIWLTIVGDGSENDPFRPDVPTGKNGDATVSFKCIAVPCRLRADLPRRDAGGAFTGKGDDSRPHQGDPIPHRVLVEVDDADVKKLNDVAPGRVSDTSKLIARVFPHAREPDAVQRLADKDNDGTDEASWGEHAEKHRHRIDRSVVHRRRWARLLVRLCRRGFPMQKARHIIQKHRIDRDETNR